jgi:hypothetical protein
MQLLQKTNFIGAIVTIIFYISAIFIFTSRLTGKQQIGHWIGIFEFFLAIPLVYLLIKAPELNRPIIYYIQITLMLCWLIMELLLDYLLNIDFRQIRWLLITYVTIFFAASGGMIGIAANAGKFHTIISIILFLIMAVLAFIQRIATGF